MRLIEKAPPPPPPKKGERRLQRLWFHLGSGLPLIFLVIGIAGVYAVVRYFSPAHDNLTTGSDTGEEEKVIEDPKPLGYTFESAYGRWIAEGEESLDDVRGLMRSFISPGSEESTEGRARAHLWLGEDLFEAASWETGDERDLVEKEAEEHLRKAMELNPEDDEAYSVLGRLLVRRERFGEAKALYEALVSRRPGLYGDLAFVLEAAGEDRAVRAEAERAVRHWSDVSQNDPENSWALLQLARAEHLLGHADRVEEILRGAPSELPHGPAFDALKAELRLDRAIAALRASPRRTDEALNLLQEALTLDPNFDAAIEWLADTAVHLPSSRLHVRSILSGLASQDRVAWRVYFALGSLRLVEDDHAAARAHLEEAHRLNPDHPLVAAHLAWCLSKMEPPRLEEALGLIEQVWERDPALKTHPLYLDIHGNVLLRLGVKDLETIKGMLPEVRRRETSEVLDEAYDALGAKQ